MKKKIRNILEVWENAMLMLTAYVECKKQGQLRKDRMKNYFVEWRIETLKAEYEEQKD